MDINAQSEEKQTPRKKRKEKRPPKKITASYLRNSGLYYLERFPASSGHFRTVMTRKIKRSCAHHKDQSFEDCQKLLGELVSDFIELGLLNDEAYAYGSVTSLRRRGKGTKAILMQLKQKGLSEELIQESLTRYEEAEGIDAREAEMKAALTLARKKRLGPFKGDKDIHYEKALGILARGGFSYDTSRCILEMKEEDLEGKF